MQDTFEDAEYVGVGKLRQSMNSENLEDLKRPIVVTGPRRDNTMAIFHSWDQWQEIMKVMSKVGQ